jgi:type VI protein secretion system component VasK
MSWDSGGAIILSSVITVVLMWIGGLVTKHFGNNESNAASAHDRISEIAKDMVTSDAALNAKIVEVALDLVKHQRYVAENYARIPALQRIEDKLDQLLAQGGQRRD